MEVMIRDSHAISKRSGDSSLPAPHIASTRPPRCLPCCSRLFQSFSTCKTAKSAGTQSDCLRGIRIGIEAGAATAQSQPSVARRYATSGNTAANPVQSVTDGTKVVCAPVHSGASDCLKTITSCITIFAATMSTDGESVRVTNSQKGYRIHYTRSFR